ncbi:hypothetical protein HGM15179_011957 [Zosterops borbonicus]|uniref:Uncharacterized protein n=1 Tax=Zosterops borbonicus TaxID=364589 RepID=A0A8K1GBL9_9PASS|nr:hypothetical protein HGM15179_011957 [Zosterops borbonicus]
MLKTLLANQQHHHGVSQPAGKHMASVASSYQDTLVPVCLAGFRTLVLTLKAQYDIGLTPNWELYSLTETLTLQSEEVEKSLRLAHRSATANLSTFT